MSEAGGQAARLLLPFAPGCCMTRLVRRAKRFTVVTLDPATGGEVRAHTNNTGSMLGLLRPGAFALLSPARNPDRVLKWTLEALGLPGAPCLGKAPDPASLQWVGVNTLTPNRLLEAAFCAGLLPETRGYARLTREAITGESRLDALLTPEQGSGLPLLYVECKNVTLVEDGQAQFPDAASERGRKHLAELTRLVHEGCRAALFFLVQRPDGGCFAPAEAIDPAYAEALAVALAAGVECWAWRAHVSEAGIALAARLPLAPCWAARQRLKEFPAP
ncbi:MAG: DNA/RNA nuclease SfsA [Proteobacteria bacterium]|nr:DNA/RNA nuclease SfsA [Pseudomonadota bacterium]MBU1595253.1 DNA/RNA nuclease SfsA [Pseudomonadota bacterium]